MAPATRFSALARWLGLQRLIADTADSDVTE
jgi:hypothetical protein